MMSESSDEEQHQPSQLQVQPQKMDNDILAQKLQMCNQIKKRVAQGNDSESSEAVPRTK